MSNTVSATVESTPVESVYVIRDDVSPSAITNSLRALLSARHQPIARRRFTLLDTFDFRVARAGGRLTRAGVNGGATLEWQPRGGPRLEIRPDRPVSFAWDLPDGPLHQRLAPVLGVRRLLAQVEAEEHGSLLEILDDEGKTTARVRIQTGRVRRPLSRTGWTMLPTTIALTGLRGYEDEYRRLVPVIESRPGLEPAPEGYVGVMLRAAGAPEPFDPSWPVELVPSVPAGTGARQVHQALLEIVMKNEPGVHAALDSEFLHDFRVSIRRTRSLLRQIRNVFPDDAVEHFSSEFSWLGRLTGPSRDMDVLVLALREGRLDVPGEDATAVIGCLRAAQQDEHRKLVEALDSARYRRLLSDWQAFLRGPSTSEVVPLNARTPLAEVISRRARRLYRRIVRSSRAIDGGTAPAQLHEVRIAAKKLRYLVDISPSFYQARDLGRILGALKSLQRVLGDFNDAHVQERRLLECGHAVGAAGGPAGAILTLGRLAEQRRQRGEGLRAAVHDELARFCAHDTRSACRRAFKKPVVGPNFSSAVSPGSAR